MLGQIMSVVGTIEEGHARTADEIRGGMSGNLCRGAAHPRILTAIQHAKKTRGSVRD